jgi:hypothetical protein
MRSAKSITVLFLLAGLFLLTSCEGQNITSEPDYNHANGTPYGRVMPDRYWLRHWAPAPPPP